MRAYMKAAERATSGSAEVQIRQLFVIHATPLSGGMPGLLVRGRGPSSLEIQGVDESLGFFEPTLILCHDGHNFIAFNHG